MKKSTASEGRETEAGMAATVPAADAELPLVSIGVAVYNEAKHLAEALDSLRAQDYPNIEIMISDNASTDATPQICAEYVARDPRIRYHRNDTNIGSFDNFNQVFHLARGEFFMWASGHDVRHPSQVSKCVEVMLEDRSIVLCYSQVIWVDDKLQSLEKGKDYIDTRGLELSILRINVVLWALRGGHPSYGVFRTQALKKTPVYTNVVSPDMSLLVELAAVGKFAYIPEPPFYVRRRDDFEDWAAFVTKHFGEKLQGRKPQTLYWSMMRELPRRVASHIRTIPGKILAVLSVVLGMSIKFRWMLTGLRSIKAGPPATGPQEHYDVVYERSDVRSDAKGA